MCNIKILAPMLCCFLTIAVYAQSDTKNSSISYSTPIEVIVTEEGQSFYQISLQKGQTLYALCSDYGVAMMDALRLNDISKPEDIAENQQLIFPINKDHFSRNVKQKEGQTPVYYRVKSKETLFRISKVYFSQDIKDMIERNSLSGFSLQIDQALIVGYFQNDKNVKQKEVIAKTEKPTISQESLERKPVVLDDRPVFTKVVRTEEHEAVAEIIPTEVTNEEVVNEDSVNEIGSVTEMMVNEEQKSSVQSEAINEENVSPLNESSIAQEDLADEDLADEAVDEELPNEEMVEEIAEEEGSEEVEEAKLIPSAKNVVHIKNKGVAYWDKKGSDYENLMVLHKSAEVNTLVKITNPVNGLSTFARVVGSIPQNAFKRDVDVVISPAVAKKIGARDSRTQVEMTYQINKP